MLLSNGFPWQVVQKMPIGMLWTEASFIQERTNAVLATHSILIHAAIADAVGGGGAFKQAIERLTEDG